MRAEHRLWLTGAATLICAGSTAGCESAAPTGIVLDIRSNLLVPGEIDRLTLNVRNQDRFLLSRDYPLGSQPGKWTLPSSVALVPAASPSAVINIEALAELGSQVMIARTLSVPFIPEQVHRAVIDLDRECLGVLCPPGKTCIPGQGCAPVESEPGTPATSRGPPCDCQSYFPICAGATWTYEELSFNTNIPTSKSYLVQDYARLEGNAHDKGGKSAFLQFRVTDGGLSRRWLSQEGEPGARRLMYEKDDYFDNRWSPVLSTYFVPGRLRLDETRARVGETWTTDYLQFDYRTNFPPDAPLKVTDQWAVVPPELPPRLRNRFGDLLCHRRVSFVVEDLPSVGQVYCFARGVGKVYENTPGNDEEVLRDHDIPGCPKVPR